MNERTKYAPCYYYSFADFGKFFFVLFCFFTVRLFLYCLKLLLLLLLYRSALVVFVWKKNDRSNVCVCGNRILKMMMIIMFLGRFFFSSVNQIILFFIFFLADHHTHSNKQTGSIVFCFFFWPFVQHDDELCDVILSCYLIN